MYHTFISYKCYHLQSGFFKEFLKFCQRYFNGIFTSYQLNSISANVNNENSLTGIKK